MRALRGVTVFLNLLLLAAFRLPAQPVVNHIFPPAGQLGTTSAVTAAGKFDSWPPKTIWVDAPGIAFKPATNNGRFDVAIARDAAPGPHLVRFIDARGSSAPRFFIVSGEPQLLETEPNDDFTKPQRVGKLPAELSGRLDKSGDVDSFAVSLKRGQTLLARLEAYVLMSTFDGLVRVLDTNGTQLAFNHDGRTLDPSLRWEAPRDDTFVVQVMGFVHPATADVRFTGGDTCVYRLHLAAPAGASDVPPDNVAATAETEPNDSPGNAGMISVPAAVQGAIQRAGDEDRFAFPAAKAKAYEFKLIAARAGSPLDAWLKIESTAGKELARNDDAEGSRDPQLTWTAPSNGTFVAAVGDLTHRGGREFAYRLDVTEAAPAVTATVANHFFSVQPGRTNEIKVAIKRLNGFNAGLQLAARDLPPGVTAGEGAIGGKSTEGTLKLIAAAGAPPANQPLRLVLREKESGHEHPVRHVLTTTGENNGVPQGYSELVIGSTDQLWLTVSTEPPAVPKKKRK